MALEQITQVTGRAVYVPGDDVDTDRIIPARYLKCVTFDGLAEFTFHDERKHPDGSEKPHPLNDPRFLGRKFFLPGPILAVEVHANTRRKRSTALAFVRFWRRALQKFSLGIRRLWGCHAS